MDYKPMTAVWEITMGCNMRCMHCGSICESPLEDELTTVEALDLCSQIADMGLKWITLSGGEPFTRKDWHQIVRSLSERGVLPNMITNGWNLDEKTLSLAKESGVSTIAISVDGPRDVHDKIRKEGSFDRLTGAFERMDTLGITSGAVTTVSTMNINKLDAIMDFLVEKRVKFWQLQIGLPMGSMAKNDGMILGPDAVDDILKFIHDNKDNDKIKIYPADCLGYYTRMESEIRESIFGNHGTSHWDGCHAGKRSFGILQNGQILGCTSIRDKEFIEGSVRDRSLEDIWKDTKAFLWNREMEKSKLDGYCTICDYGDLCKGGCPNTRLTMEKSIYSENKYCSYNNALRKTSGLISTLDDEDALYIKAEKYAQSGELTLAYLVLDDLIHRETSLKACNLMGYVAFMLGDYEKSLEVNKMSVKLQPDNAYALKGLGLSLYRLNKENPQAIESLEKAKNLDTSEDLDTYYDLANVYFELGEYEKAISVIHEGKARSGVFSQNIESLHKHLIQLQH